MSTLILVVTTVTTAVVFSVQNSSAVNISFLFWHFDISLDLLVFVSLVVGMMNGVLYTSLRSSKRAAKDTK